jgi:hypothetical protein
MPSFSKPPLNDGVLKGGHHMTTTVKIKAVAWPATAVKKTIFVIVVAAAILLASKHLW